MTSANCMFLKDRDVGMAVAYTGRTREAEETVKENDYG